MNGSADLFGWAQQAKAKRRGPRPLGFYSALAVVVKYGRLAAKQPPRQDLKVRRPSPASREAPRPLPLFDPPRPPEVATRTCPRCGHVGAVDKDFGSRRLKGELRPQSWCRQCRAIARRARRDADAATLDLLAS